jgi:VWFA-related protein
VNAGTLLYDAIFLASDEVMSKQTGRKAIIVLTDGVDHGSKMSLDRAIEAAQRADTMVYSIYFPGQEGGGFWGGGSEDGKRVLDRLSRETGGRMFAVSHKESIEQIYRQIQDELRSQYNLGYTPDRAAGGSQEFRKIHVTTRRNDLIVQARQGYYASQQAASGSGR